MEVDRYTKFVLTVIALALSTLAFKDIIAPQPAIAGMGQFPSSISVSHSGFICREPSSLRTLLCTQPGGSIGGVDEPAPSPDGQ